MASNEDIRENLTGYHIVRLGQVILPSSMESIAIGYMNIEIDKLKHLKAASTNNPEIFVRDLIQEWANRNPHNQIQVRKSHYRPE